jgi:hypothetical protein
MAMRKDQYKMGLLGVLGLVLALTACAGKVAAPAGGQPELAGTLPTVASLDGLSGDGGRGARAVPIRQTSAVQNEGADVTAPLASTFGQAGASSWTFQVQPANHAWAVYRFPAPAAGSTLLKLQAAGNARLWMLVADYTSGRWRAQQMDVGVTEFGLQTGGSWVSPGDNIYCAFVLPAATAGNATLTSLNLQYDDGQPSGPQLYVAPTGDDGNDGSQAHPWLTLQHAADVVQPGDTVNVLPGNYTGFMLQTSGASGQPIRFLAQPGAIINANNDQAPNGHTPDGINLENWDAPPPISYVVIDGFTLDGDNFPVRPRCGIRIAGNADNGTSSFAHHITISNNHLANCREFGILTGHVNDILIESNECSGSINQHGIYHSNSGDRATLRNNICHGNHGCGIHTNGDLSSGGDGMISDCLFEGNIVYENAADLGSGLGGGSGINSDGVRNSTYRNNLLFNNHASGISLYMIDAGAPAIGNFVTNNTICMPNDGRWAINIADASTGATLRNNILLNDHSFRGSITLTPDCVNGFTSDYNVVMDRLTNDDGNTVQTLAGWKVSTGQDMHSLVATEAQLFVTPNGNSPGDYQLSATSLAKNKGGVQNAPSVDILGNPRPAGGAFDIGCYELQ